MAPGPPFAAASLLGILVAGCAAPGITGTGSAHVVLPATREIQYVAADIQALQVTITHQASGRDYVKTFPSGSRLDFVADNLVPGGYQAKVEAFLDLAKTMVAGSTSSTPFVVTAFATTPVTLPSLKLAATPIGDWRLTLGVSLHNSYVVTGYDAQLNTPAGTVVAAPSGTSLPATNAFTWGNVPASPGGLSTCSITVTASNKKDRALTKTWIATASIVAGATISSPLTITFP